MFSVKKEKLNSKNLSDLYYVLPISLILAIVPLIVYMKLINLSGIEVFSWIAPSNMDFFSFYKSRLLQILALIAIAVLIYRYFFAKYKVPKYAYFVPVSVYFLFSVLSTVFSECNRVAINGYVERSEGILTLTAYVVILVSAMCLVNSDNSAKAIIYAVAFSGLILGLIGITQFLCFDIFKTDIGRELILPQEYHQLAAQLNFTYGIHSIYATLYNPNYVGTYAAIILPIAIGLLAYQSNKILKVFSGVLCCLSIVLLVGSKSMAGLAGFAIGAIVLLILAWKRIAANKAKAIPLISAFIVSILVLNFVTGNWAFGQVKSQSTNKSVSSGTDIRIEQVKVEEKDLILKTDKAYLRIKPQGEKLSFEDENGQEIPGEFSTDGHKISLKDAKYSSFRFEINPNSFDTAYIGDGILSFEITSEGIRVIGSDGRVKKPESVESIGFKDNETFAEGRGYIWSRAIPMLKDTLLLGHGPDTFAVFFPQNDFQGKLNAFGNANILVDKPYNIYLQAGINTGVLSLLAFLILCGAYIVSSIKRYSKCNFNNFKDIFGVCILASIIGYCVTGLFNDSVVSVAPIFWALLGLGIAINRLKKEEDRSTKKLHLEKSI